MKCTYFLGLLFLTGCGSDTNVSDENVIDNDEVIINEKQLSPVDFNNEISFMQERVLSQIDVLFKSDSTNIDLNFENTKFEIDLNIQSLESMLIPADGEKLKEAMLEFLNFYNTELDGGFQRMIELIKKPVWTDAEVQEVEFYDIEFADAENLKFGKVAAEQEQFARANKIELQEL